jgi:hypothetical protein
VLEAVFILLESPSPSRRIFIGSHSLPPPLWFAVSVLQLVRLVLCTGQTSCCSRSTTTVPEGLKDEFIPWNKTTSKTKTRGTQEAPQTKANQLDSCPELTLGNSQQIPTEPTIHLSQKLTRACTS